MSIFLLLKQIVDIFYSYVILDYLMLGLVVLIVMHQIWMLRKDKCEDGSTSFGLSMLSFSDVCVGGMAILFLAHIFIDKDVNYFMVGKISTVFLLYLMGRLCRERIEECSTALVISSYFVVYANVLARIIIFNGNEFWKTGDSNGLLYYFDTDLAYAMLLSLIFIAMYAKNHIIKFVTIFITCPFMILHSDADIQKILMIIIYIILFLFMAERAVKKRKITDFLLPVAVIGLLFVIGSLILPVFIKGDTSKYMNLINGIINTDNFAGRYSVWDELLGEMGNTNPINIIFGTGIEAAGPMGNQYLAIFVATGVIGLILSLLFIISISAKAVKISDRKTYYVTVMLAILFLGTCIVVNGMEYTQLSWLPMLYMGMAAGGPIGKNSEIV